MMGESYAESAKQKRANESRRSSPPGTRGLAVYERGQLKLACAVEASGAGCEQLHLRDAAVPERGVEVAAEACVLHTRPVPHLHLRMRVRVRGSVKVSGLV